MLKKILAGLAAVLVILALVVATRPDTFQLERSTVIPAPAEVVYARLIDFHRWVGWSPWEKLDPAMKVSYAGPTAGVGASYAWVGNDKVGEGKMTVAKVHSPDLVVIQLEFIKPFAAVNDVRFTLEPDGGGTKTTWGMRGHNNFFSKMFSMMVDMDKMVGPDFERGLAGLKALSLSDLKARDEGPQGPQGSRGPEAMAAHGSDGGVQAAAVAR